jgi:hypothetical protein
VERVADHYRVREAAERATRTQGERGDVPRGRRMMIPIYYCGVLFGWMWVVTTNSAHPDVLLTFLNADD